jgi:hypothetical protein
MDDDAKFGKWMLKYTNYWQCVLRFGLPLILVVRGITYLEFRLRAGKTGMRYPYPFPFEFAVDICVMLFASTLWWWVMRKLVALSSKSTEK